MNKAKELLDELQNLDEEIQNLDNLEKAVYDSISKAGVVWTDDNIIVEHTTRKVYSPRPRIEVGVEEILWHK